MTKGDFVSMFQFHTGSIKRLTEKMKVTLIVAFQFHTGSIKSNVN